MGRGGFGGGAVADPTSPKSGEVRRWEEFTAVCAASLPTAALYFIYIKKKKKAPLFFSLSVARLIIPLLNKLKTLNFTLPLQPAAHLAGYYSP